MLTPADSHVHSEWSWDAPGGSMIETCARAVEIGLPALAFTEHLDLSAFTVDAELIAGAAHLERLYADGVLTAPPFDAVGYLAAIERCRERFPHLRIMSGLEVGEPHWHADAAARILAAGTFDRVLGSLHCLPADGGLVEPPGLFARGDGYAVMRDYLAEVARLVSASDQFTVLAHIDFPLRYWPAGVAPPDLSRLEAEFRHALRATAESGKALEVNTNLPLHSMILGWWRDEGGQAITFGSDAHVPSRLARGFADATAMAQAHGFRSGVAPWDFWVRA